MYKAKGAGRQGMYKDEGAGCQGKYKDNFSSRLSTWQVDAATVPATTGQRQTTGTSTAKPSVPPEPPTYLLVLTRIDVVMLTVYRCLLLAESVTILATISPCVPLSGKEKAPSSSS